MTTSIAASPIVLLLSAAIASFLSLSSQGLKSRPQILGRRPPTKRSEDSGVLSHTVTSSRHYPRFQSYLSAQDHDATATGITAAGIMEWQDFNPSSYFQDPTTTDGRRIAKDDQYLESVRQMWNQEEAGGRPHAIEEAAVQYYASDADDDPSNHHPHHYNPLCGHILRRKQSLAAAADDGESNAKSPVPAILLFPTAAGPQDIFLYYKADVLLQNLDCAVMICDIMSDADGWGWDPKRARYTEVKDSLMKDEAKLLKARVLAAVRTVCKADPTVDAQRIAAMGWCLGGQAILELAKLKAEHHNFSVPAMVTFHGVFNRGAPLVPDTKPTTACSTSPGSANNTVRSSRVLICNGKEDPFVAPADLTEATEYFEAFDFEVEILQLDKAKHGFTNPAQDFNTDPAFAFSREGAALAWKKAIELLRGTVVTQ